MQSTHWPGSSRLKTAVTAGAVALHLVKSWALRSPEAPPAEAPPAEAPPAEAPPAEAPATVRVESASSNPPPPKRWKILTTSGIVTLALLAAALAQTAGGGSVLKSAGLDASSTPFTEIYFPNPGTLPVAAAPHHRRQLVLFVIRNEQHRSMTYRWRIDPPGAGRPTAGRTVLGVDQQTTAGGLVRIVCRSPRVRIQVTLLDPRETIGFWERCGSALQRRCARGRLEVRPAHRRRFGRRDLGRHSRRPLCQRPRPRPLGRREVPGGRGRRRLRPPLHRAHHRKINRSSRHSFRRAQSSQRR